MAFGYPVLLELTGRRAVVIGEFAVEAGKVEGLLVAGAEVTVIAKGPEAVLARFSTAAETLNIAISRTSHQTQKTAVQAHEKKKIASGSVFDGRHDIISGRVADFKLAVLERPDEEVRAWSVGGFDFETMLGEETVSHGGVHRQIISCAKLDEP